MTKNPSPGRKKAEIDPAIVPTIDQIFPSILPAGWFDDVPDDDGPNPLFADPSPELRLKLQACFREVITAIGNAEGYKLITSEVYKLERPKGSSGRPKNEPAFLIELDHADRFAPIGQKTAARRVVCKRYGKVGDGLKALKDYRTARKVHWENVTGAGAIKFPDKTGNKNNS